MSKNCPALTEAVPEAQETEIVLSLPQPNTPKRAKRIRQGSQQSIWLNKPADDFIRRKVEKYQVSKSEVIRGILNTHIDREDLMRECMQISCDRYIAEAYGAPPKL